MALNLGDRVKETTVTTGTGTYDLAGAATGFQGFVAGVGNGNTCYYIVTNDIDWEVGLGTVTDAVPDTLARSVISSSNGDAPVNWGAGTKNVFVGLAGSIMESFLANGLTGIIVQTADNTFSRRTITASGNLSMANGNGVSGNPAISLSEGTGSNLDADTVDGDHSPKIVPGLQMVFHESAAPTGWTQQALNDQVLVVTNAAGTGTGGTISIAGGSLPSGNQSADHSHYMGSHIHNVSFTQNTGPNSSTGGGGGGANAAAPSHYHQMVIDRDTDAGNATSVWTGGILNVHNHTTDVTIKYRKVIICNKDA